jgi:hypothetical protein
MVCHVVVACGRDAKIAIRVFPVVFIYMGSKTGSSEEDAQMPYPAQCVEHVAEIHSCNILLRCLDGADAQGQCSVNAVTLIEAGMEPDSGTHVVV